MNRCYLCSVCENEAKCYKWDQLVYPGCSCWLWMDGSTLQHYLMSCFYFSHVSLTGCSLKIRSAINWFLYGFDFLFLCQLMHWQVQHCRIISDLCNLPHATKGLKVTPNFYMCWPTQCDPHFTLPMPYILKLSPCTTQQITIKQKNKQKQNK